MSFYIRLYYGMFLFICIVFIITTIIRKSILVYLTIIIIITIFITVILILLLLVSLSFLFLSLFLYIITILIIVIIIVIVITIISTVYCRYRRYYSIICRFISDNLLISVICRQHGTYCSSRRTHCTGIFCQVKQVKQSGTSGTVRPNPSKKSLCGASTGPGLIRNFAMAMATVARL